MLEFEAAGEKRSVDVEEMTIAELELASIQGNEIAKKELERRRSLI